jgi:prepilin-type N-terminal cleavage/methylation domain-containing protein
MERAVLSSNRGFTLIEMLIALVIILLGLLGLLNAAFLSIDNNLKNLLRDEAVRIAEQQMNVLKSLPLTDVAYNPPASSGLGATNGQQLPPVITYFGTYPVQHLVGNNLVNGYAVYLIINNLTTDHSKKSIQVYVGWTYRNQSPTALQTPTQQEYQYMISSIVSSTQ